ncbi:MAG: 4Fe-4S dicluster domain-containing protein [Burkholderiales bacterium]|jgi:ferredoxin-type protein NapG|nr:4Fe-4S dicluster domain-containing protein [Burkholderiales bacterium]
MAINRRKFAQGVTIVAFMAGIPGAGYLAFGRAHEKDYLRPPGARDEREFLSLCIKCGQCVQVCPYYAVFLLDIDEGTATGTPVIRPEIRGCYLCDLLPCVLACPTTALNHDVSTAEQVRMGVAILTDREGCLAYQKKPVTSEMIDALIAHGVRSEQEKELAEKLREYSGKNCSLCRDFCPYPERDAAITLNDDEAPEFHEQCVGCAVCGELCPTQVIEMMPRKTYQEIYRKETGYEP